MQFVHVSDNDRLSKTRAKLVADMVVRFGDVTLDQVRMWLEVLAKSQRTTKELNMLISALTLTSVLIRKSTTKVITTYEEKGKLSARGTRRNRSRPLTLPTLCLDHYTRRAAAAGSYFFYSP